MAFPIYVIACEGDNPRVASAEKQVRKVFGREAIFIPGIHKDSPTFYERAGVRKDELEMVGLREGDLACALAHHQALLAFLQTSYSHALILEDDICFCQDTTREDFVNTFEELNSVFTDWDWVWLRVPFTWDTDQPIYSDENPGKLVRHATRIPLCTSCYGISRKGAARLLSLTRKIAKPIDMYVHQTPEGARAYVGPYLSCIGPGISITNSPPAAWPDLIAYQKSKEEPVVASAI